VWLLKTLPLNVAYPFVGFAFVLVPLMGAFFLDESLDWRHLAGGALIAVGVAVASWR
jgi:multidrug transporter EmrE-like cation transporter